MPTFYIRQRGHSSLRNRLYIETSTLHLNYSPITIIVLLGFRRRRSALPSTLRTRFLNELGATDRIRVGTISDRNYISR